MPSKFDFLSPGIQITEVDESIITPTPDEDGPIIIGRTRKGPAMKPVKVRNMSDYISVFGAPIPGGQSETGDVWRDGAGCKAPTYASYAAQAWLASGEAPVNMVRLLGVTHDAPHNASAWAGWQVTNAKPNPDIAHNGTAYGLFICPKGDGTNFGTGSLAAIIYCDEGALRLSGTLAGTTDLTSAAETFVETYSDGLGFILESVGTDGGVDEKIHFSFDRNGANYIRNVLNTDPTLVNGSLSWGADKKNYWLGESFCRSVEEVFDSTSFSKGEQYGVLLALHQAGQEEDEQYNWGYHKLEMEEAKSGWVIGNDSGVPGDYDAKSATKMFQLAMLHEGESMQDDILIAFEDLKLPSNPSAYNYSSFTIRIMDKAGNTLEKFSNLVLDPASPNYLLRKIGDMYQTWDSTAKRYRAWGDFQNASDYVRVIKPPAGLPGDKAMLPFGFLGPGRPKGFVTGMGIDGVQPMHDVDNATPTRAKTTITFGAGNSDIPTAADTLAVIIQGVTYTITFGAGGADDNTFTGTAMNINLAVRTDCVSISGRIDNAFTVLGLSGWTNTYAANGGNASTIIIEADVVGAQFTITTTDLADNLTTVDILGVTEDDWANAPVNVGQAVPFGSPSVGTGVYFKDGTSAYTASFVFPSIAMRESGGDGFTANPYKAYFGINPKIDKDSTIHDVDYCDYLRPLPYKLAANLHDPGSDFEYSVAFSLDDVVVNDALNSVGWSAGSRALSDATKRSWTAASGAAELLSKGVSRWVMPMFGGRDGLDITEIEPFASHQILGTGDHKSYVDNSLNMALDSVADEEVVPANLMLMPGVTKPKITTKMIRVCETRQDTLAILDLQGDYEPAEQTTDRTAVNPSVSSAVTSLKSRNLNSSYACAFFPWVQIVDTVNNQEILWAPASVAALGAMAGSQAASDVWFAPAGFNRGGLGELGGAGGPRVLQAKMRLDSGERDDLYVQNINPIATFPNEGVVIFGQKTLQQTQSALDRINVRRLMLYLKRKIAAVAKGILFDQNVEATWNRFKSNATPILDDVQSRYGLTEYKLILDETTTTPDLIDRNILYAKVYLKPARAIEFIAIDFIISKTGAEFA